MRQRFTQESDFRQLRDFGQKFSATFEFIGEHWRGLGQALLYIVLPAALLQGIVSGLVQKQMLTSGVYTERVRRGAGMLEQMAVFNTMRQSSYYWVSVATGAVFVTLLLLTVYAYVRCCLRPQPSAAPITAGQVWNVVKEQFLSSFFSYFGLVFVLIVGMAFLLIPGIYLSVALSLFYAVKVMEGTGFGDTFRRCLTLTRGKWWSTFGLLFVMMLMLGVILAIGGSIVGGLFYGLVRGFLGPSITDTSNSLGLFAVITTSIGSLFNLLIYPPLLIALAFQYFNLVERHDGVGLRNMVNQLGQAPPAAANETYRPDDEGEY